jgi:hypothetical protein
MLARCIKGNFIFKKNNYYTIYGIYSVYEKNDFISLLIDDQIYRFRLNKSFYFTEDFIGLNEYYFYDYFVYLNEERQNKLNKISEL